MNGIIEPVYSIGDLKFRAEGDKNYEMLAITAAKNLGGNPHNLKEAVYLLQMNAMETDEFGIVDEINACRELV